MPKNLGGRFQNQFGTSFKDMFGISKADAGKGATNTLFKHLQSNPNAIENGVFVGDTSGLTGRAGNNLFDDQGTLLAQGMRGGQPAPEQTAPPAAEGDQGPGVGEKLVGQGVDLANVGSKILSTPGLGIDPTLRAGEKLSAGGFQDIGSARQFANQAAGRSGNIQDVIQKQLGDARGEVDQLFSGQPLDDFRSRVANMNAQNVGSGRVGSRSANEMQAELQRGLLRDRAQAQLGVGQQSRAAQLGELGQQRATDLNLASLMSGQGLGQTQQGVGAFGQAGQLDQNRQQLGANIANQGFQNQLGALGFLNNAEMQRFQMQNQLLQQLLANVQGNKQNKATMDLIRQQMGQGGGLFSGIGSLLGAAGGAAAGAFGG